MQEPETRYVAVGDADVAYKVIGDGPIDLLYGYGLGSHLDYFWEYEMTRNVFLRLAEFSRLIFFDRRGTGASDGVPGNALPTWEEWTEDLDAVLDAAGSGQAAVIASLDASPIAILHAAMHPERVSSLILINPVARFLVDDDYPIGVPEEDMTALVAWVREGWGKEEAALIANPSCADDPEFRAFLCRIPRASATPRSAARQYDYALRNDVRGVLPMVQAPTLVVHSRDNAFIPSAMSRFVAEHIPRSTFVEMPSGDVGIAPFMMQVADHIEEFLTGSRPPVAIERVLTTVLFTDIVGSTERAAALGDRRWRTLLDHHDRLVRTELRHFRGTEVNTTGDGFIASFDGPARAIRCARAISDAAGAIGVELHVGLHTGECEVRGDDLGGLAVHIAARVAAMAPAGEVLVSSTVKDLVVGSDLEFADRGEHTLKGVPGRWRLFALAAEALAVARPALVES